MLPFADLIGSVEESAPGPLYQQLERRIRDAIKDKKLSPGDPLPAERDLATQLSVSRITVRKALDNLVSEGLLTRKQGTGTYVGTAEDTTRVEKSFSKMSSFTEDMRARGRVPRSEWLSRTRGEVTPEESLTLCLSPGTPVYRFHRIRFADDIPMALEYSAVPAFCLSSLESVESSLYDALDKTGHRPVRALQRLRAILFTAEQTERLGMAPGSCGLLIERRSFARDGRIVEVTQSYYRGDSYDFVAELNACD